MAVEIKDGKKILVTPVSAEDLKDIHIGDIVYLTGDITTCRDVAHRRVVEEGREIPVDVRDAAILHAGPIIRPLGDDKYEMVSVGPTTSMRMEKFEYEFVETTGVRVIVGKGGMKENTERACKDFGAIHCVFPAGNAVVAAVEVEEIVEAQWKDLGMPETLWHCHVKEFGPLIVSIDSYGRNYFEEKKDKRRVIDIVRASSSLPFVCPVTYVDNIPMLDGGIADSIPLMRARCDGYDRNVVVLTRNRGYRKDIQGTKVPSFIYKKYPRLREAINRRSSVYNEQLELVERLEDAGEITVIRPQKPIVVDRIERDISKLTDLYEEGYACAAAFSFSSDI